jgi:hypothetical protein
MTATYVSLRARCHYTVSIHERVRSLKKLTFATPKELIALLCRRRRAAAAAGRSEILAMAAVPMLLSLLCAQRAAAVGSSSISSSSKGAQAVVLIVADDLVSPARAFLRKPPIYIWQLSSAAAAV